MRIYRRRRSPACRFPFEMSHSHSACHPNVAYDTKMRLDLLATMRPGATRMHEGVGVGYLPNDGVVRVGGELR